MWFMNHLASPVVRGLLRSPLHGLLSGSVLLVAYAGRRSGREVTVPVQYRRPDEAYVVAVGAPEAKNWWRNFADGHPARLLVRRGWVEVTGRVEVGPDGATGVVFTPTAAAPGTGTAG